MPPVSAPKKAFWWRWWRIARRTIRGVTRLEDTPYRIAMGCACGLFASPLPILGQMLLGMGLARLFRANVVAAMPWTWITNPFTTFPIWYGCYVIGSAALLRDPLGFAEIRALFTRVDEIGLVGSLREGGSLLLGILAPLWIGTVLVGLLLGAVGYIAMRWLAIRVRAHRAEKAARWHRPLGGQAANDG